MNAPATRPGGAAPWLLAAGCLALVFGLRSEFDRTTFEPSELDRSAPAASEVFAHGDSATAPRPGAGDSAPGTGGTAAAATAEVHLRVRHQGGVAAPWRGVGLRRIGTTGRRLGFTDASGDARLAVPVELAGAVGAGELEAFVRDPGRPDLAAVVPPVSGARAPTVDFTAPKGVVARLVVMDGQARTLIDRLSVHVRVERDGASEPLAFSVVGGSAYVAGLPTDAVVRFVAKPYGLPPIERWAKFFGEASEHDVSLPIERPAADVEAAFGPHAKKGDVVRLALWFGVRAGEPAYVAYGTCDERGFAQFAAPPGASATFEARGADGSSASWFVPRVAPRETTVLVPPRKDAPRCKGRVLTAGGDPAVGATVVLSAASGTATRAAASPMPAGVADDDGRFDFAGAPDVPWRAQARHLGEAEDVVFTAEGPESPGGGAADIVLRLDPGGVVSGRLVSYPSEFFAGDGPQLGISVEDSAGVVLGYGTPAVDGTFSVGAPRGLRRVRVFAPGVEPLVFEDVAAEADGEQDPRLEALRPRASFATTVIRVERADAPADGDARLVGALVTARFPGPDAASRSPLAVVTESLGIARLAVEQDAAATFVVTWEDPERGDLVFRPEEVRGVGRKVVRLRPGALVTFAGGEALPDPHPDTTAAFIAVREGPTDGVEPPRSRALWRPWRRGSGPPRLASVPNGKWRAKLEIVREGSDRGATTLDLGEFVVGDADTAVSVPFDVAAAARALNGP